MIDVLSGLFSIVLNVRIHLYSNQISKVCDSVTTSEYDGFNQLVMVRDAAGTYYYGYNADGLRTAKCINGIATTHVWDGQDLVLELGGSEGYAASMKRGESPVGTPSFGIYLLEAVKCTKYIRGVNLIDHYFFGKSKISLNKYWNLNKIFTRLDLNWLTKYNL